MLAYYDRFDRFDRLDRFDHFDRFDRFDRLETPKRSGASLPSIVKDSSVH